MRMSAGQMAEALDISITSVLMYQRQIIIDAGMSDRFEFALTQNASIRERYYANNKKEN